MQAAHDRTLAANETALTELVHTSCPNGSSIQNFKALQAVG